MRLGMVITIGGWQAKCIGLIDSGKYCYAIFKNLQDNILKVCFYAGKDIAAEQNELTFIPVHWEEVKNPQTDYWETLTAAYMGEFDKIVDSKLSMKKRG